MLVQRVAQSLPIQTADGFLYAVVNNVNINWGLRSPMLVWRHLEARFDRFNEVTKLPRVRP